MNEAPRDKLYIAVRADLPPGLQMAQAVHAAFQISEERPETVGHWFHSSNFLVIVSTPDMHALMQLGSRALEKGIHTSMVVEPDLADELTAIAFSPGDAARRLCSSLPCAMKPSPCTEVFLDTDGYNSMRIRSGGVHV